jgi:hypothetical protein
VAAFWGLALFVVGGIVEILAPREPGITTVPVLGILAVVAIFVLPRSARTVLPEDAERRPPTGVTLAYVVALVGGFIVHVQIDV